MANGQQTDLGQGTLTPEEGVALTGSALTVDSGTIVADAGGGIAISGEGFDFESGQLASALLIGLRSRKVGAGSAIKTLTGSAASLSIGTVSAVLSRTPVGLAASFAVGSLAKTRSILLSGQSVTTSTGVMTGSGASAGPQTGLDWDGTAPGRRMLVWTSPPPAFPLTIMLKAFPRAQVSTRSDGNKYYTFFFWGNNGQFSWGTDYFRSYYGCHPYPTPPPGGAGKWEISQNANDYRGLGGTADDGSGAPFVTNNQWYSQATTVRNVSGSTMEYTFYTDLTASPLASKIVQHTNSNGWVNPPSPALMFGQAPDNGSGQSWGGYAGWEEGNFIGRGLQTHIGILTTTQMQALGAMETDGAVLSYCATNGLPVPWFLNMNPTPTDVTDKSGNGHHPGWAGTFRPSLYTTGGTINVGALVQDGPATPEQISLFLPTTGTVAQTATATCRYRRVGDVAYTTGHPLYRIRPSMSGTPNVGTVADAFAWPIIDLVPGTQYEVEVTVTEGINTAVKTLITTTRALPIAAGAPNKTANSVATLTSQLTTLNPGDVLEIAVGTYNLPSSLQITRSGTSGSPIYIRGVSRTGTVISYGVGDIMRLSALSNIVIENMTLVGSGVDGGTSGDIPGNRSLGIRFNDAANISAVTIRNIIMTGVDRAIGPAVTAEQRLTSCLVYNNTLTGNNVWSMTDTNITWDDDGINLSGQGNCAFNNTVAGFGDSFAYASSSGGNLGIATIGVHFYRNDILHGEDDGTEADYSLRNNTFYDNRLTNTMTFLSFDPLYGGPFLACRNVSINAGRQPFKWNSQQSGQFVYSNTIVHTTTRYATTDPPAESGWYQANNGDQNSLGYRNNILVYRGNGSRITRIDNATSSYTVCDWTNNSWFPNSTFQMPTAAYANLAAAQSGLPNRTPIFSGTNRQMLNDNITINNPWTTTLTLGADYHTQVSPFTPILSGADAANNSGVAIPNVTDGFAGSAPDRGAIIGGRSIPQWGDQTPASNIPTWAQGASGTITVINSGTTISGIAAAAGANSYPGGSSDLCPPWSGGALVDVAGVPYLMAKGGGHVDGSWNGVVKFGPLLGSNSPVWSIWMPASSSGAVTSNSPTYSDGRQCATHTYNNPVGVGSSLYEMATEAFITNGFSSSNVFRTNDGSPPTQVALGSNIRTSNYGAGAHYQGKIYYISGNSNFDRLRIYTIAGSTWASESNADIAMDNYVSMAIDSTRGKILVTNGSVAFYWDIATLSRRSVNAPSGYLQCLEYDVVRDAFVAPVSGSSQVRECSASSLAAGNTPAWTTRSFTGTAPSGFVAAGTFGRWRYVPALQGCLLVTNSSANVWFYKS